MGGREKNPRILQIAQMQRTGSHPDRKNHINIKRGHHKKGENGKSRESARMGPQEKVTREARGTVEGENPLGEVMLNSLKKSTSWKEGLKKKKVSLQANDRKKFRGGKLLLNKKGRSRGAAGLRKSFLRSEIRPGSECLKEYSKLWRENKSSQKKKVTSLPATHSIERRWEKKVTTVEEKGRIPVKRREPSQAQVSEGRSETTTQRKGKER